MNDNINIERIFNKENKPKEKGYGVVKQYSPSSRKGWIVEENLLSYYFRIPPSDSYKPKVGEYVSFTIVPHTLKAKDLKYAG